MPTEDERSAIPGPLASIADALGIRLEIPDVLPGRSATFAAVVDSSGVCPLCAAERASGRGDWTYDLAELPRGGSSIRLRDGHYVCTNVGCPAMRTGSAGLAPEAWVTRLSGNGELWERRRAQWEVEMGKAEGAKVIDLETGEPVAPEPMAAPLALPQRLSLTDILDPPREVFILGKMIPLGKSSVIFGPTGGGKSTFLSQLACAFAEGQESIWGLPLLEGGGPVLVYTAEDSFDDWKRKVGAFTRAGIVDPKTVRERLWIIDQSEGAARLSEIVTEHERVKNVDRAKRVIRPTAEQDRIINEANRLGAKLIIIETASRLVDDEDNPAFSALQSALGRIARETGAAVLTSHHSTKAASKDNDSSIENARGGGAFTANARNVLALFYAKQAEAAKYPEFEPDTVLTLIHGKSTSSVKKQQQMFLVLCDPGGDLGGVLQLPEEAHITPEMREAGRKRTADSADQQVGQVRVLYGLVERLRQEDIAEGHPDSTMTFTRLRNKLSGTGIAQADLKKILTFGVQRGNFSTVGKRGRGGGDNIILGWDPRSGASAPELDASDLE